MYRDPEKNAGGQIPGPNTSPTAAPVANDEAKADQEKAAALKASEAAKVAEGAPVNAETKKGLNEMLKEMDLEKMFGDIIKSLSEAFQELAKALGGLAPSLAALTSTPASKEATPTALKEDPNIMVATDTDNLMKLITQWTNTPPNNEGKIEMPKGVVGALVPYLAVDKVVVNSVQAKTIATFKEKFKDDETISGYIGKKEFIPFDLSQKATDVNMKELNKILDLTVTSKVTLTGASGPAMALMAYMKKNPSVTKEQAMKVNNIDAKSIESHDKVIEAWAKANPRTATPVDPAATVAAPKK